MLDRIDYHIEQTNVHLQSAHGELQKVWIDLHWHMNHKTTNLRKCVLLFC
jgi:hypothetical protein